LLGIRILDGLHSRSFGATPISRRSYTSKHLALLGRETALLAVGIACDDLVAPNADNFSDLWSNSAAGDARDALESRIAPRYLRNIIVIISELGGGTKKNSFPS